MSNEAGFPGIDQPRRGARKGIQAGSFLPSNSVVENPGHPAGATVDGRNPAPIDIGESTIIYRVL